MQYPVSPFTTIVYKALSVLEIIALIAIVAGCALKYLHLAGADEILMISMSSLAAIFFLSAYRPLPPVESSGKLLGFGALLATTVVPKTGWIACAVMMTGLLFAILHLKGAHEMLLIGVMVLSVGCVLSLGFLLAGSNFGKNLLPLLYRAVPLCLIGWYVFMNLPPVRP